MDLRKGILWPLVVVVALLGPLAAVEFGGVLPWTHYVFGLAISGVGLAAAILLVTRERAIGLSWLRSYWPLILWAAFSWFQTVSLRPSFVEALSPGAFSAYTTWLEPVLPTDLLPGRFPISITPGQSRHAAAVMTLLIPLVISVGVFCRERAQIYCFLIAMSLGIGLHATYGILLEWGASLPGFGNQLFPGRSFGSYINHNNAAFLLNLGLGTSLALLVSRIAAISDVQSGTLRFAARDFRFLLEDPVALLGGGTGLVSAFGLLACGSRAGLMASVAGGVLVAAWFKRGRGLASIPAIMATTTFFLLVGIVALAPFSRGLRSLHRFERLDVRSVDGLFGDIRFQHWPDGVAAAREYFPAGAGLSSYSLAYLPYQQLGPEAWFEHADNLWLELAVEQGAFGIFFALSVLAVLVFSLFRLSKSSDPIDYGLQAAGWYIIGATVWSQCFDFGLIVGGNLFTLTCISGVLLARSRGIPTFEVSPSGTGAIDASLQHAKLSRRIFSSVVGLLSVSVAAICLPTLYRGAVNDSVARGARETLDKQFFDSGAIKMQTQWVASAIDSMSSSELYDLSARLNEQAGRLQSVTEQNLSNPDEVREAYLNAGSSARRRDRQRRSIDPSDLPEPYSAAVLDCYESLLDSPLGIESRGLLVELDFVHQKVGPSHQALMQLMALQKRYPTQLGRLGKLALDGGDPDMAGEAWKRATSLDPRKGKDAVDFVRADPSLRISAFLDESPECQRIATRHILSLKNESKDLQTQADTFLSEAVGLLNCKTCESDLDRAACEQVASDALMRLGQLEQSIQRLKEAVRLSPSSSKLRIKLLGRMVQNGMTGEALELARQSKREFPDQVRFQTIIDQISDDN